MAPQITLEDDHFPIAILRFASNLGPECVGDFRQSFEKILARRAKYVIVCDLRSVSNIPGALVRKQIADTLNDPAFRDRQVRYQVAASNIFASAPVRAAVTALLWLWTPPTPMVASASLEEAVDWGIDQLTKAHVEVPEEVHAWARSLRFSARALGR